MPALRSGEEKRKPMACTENHVVRHASPQTEASGGRAGRRSSRRMKGLLLLVSASFGLGAVLVGYAAVGVLLAVLLLAVLTLPLAIAFRRLAPARYARMRVGQPVW